MSFGQISRLSNVLGAITILSGAVALPFVWIRFNPSYESQLLYYSVLGCATFMAFNAKRERVSIDEGSRTISIRTSHLFVFHRATKHFSFTSVRWQHYEHGDPPGHEILISFPDGSRIAVYNAEAVTMLASLLPRENREAAGWCDVE